MSSRFKSPLVMPGTREGLRHARPRFYAHRHCRRRERNSSRFGGGEYERRRGMHVSYCVGWLRTEENQYLSAPPDVVRSMPRQSQELLGYAAHDALMSGGGYLGVVDLRDPVDLLADGHL